MYLHPVGHLIVKPLLDCKWVPVQIHNLVGAHAHAAAHGQPVNQPDQSLDHVKGSNTSSLQSETLPVAVSFKNITTS